MPSPSIDVGTGTTLTIAGFSYEITDMSINQSKETIDSSHLGTVDYKTYILGRLKDGGELSVNGHFDPDAIPAPIANDVEVTATITFPSGTTWVFPTLMTGYDASIPLEDKMTFSATFKVSGAITVTPSA